MGVIAQWSNFAFDLPVLKRASNPRQRSPDSDAAASPRVHSAELRLGSDALAQLLDEYRAGRSSRQLARDYGLARNTVDRLVAESGTPRQAPKMTEDERQRAIDLYLSGLSTAKVGEILGRSQGSIWQLLKRRGVPMRDPQGKAIRGVEVRPWGVKY